MAVGRWSEPSNAARERGPGLLPTSGQEAAATLAAVRADGLRLRIRGGGTKSDWANFAAWYDLTLETSRLNRLIEHNEGDLTAVLQAGTPLAEAQRLFAEAGQMLALDPPLGRDSAATIGGIVASGDSGPLRHRYGSARDLVIGMKMALPDGTVAKSGGKVIKNVAGYDLARLFCGSFGTLGLIVEVAVRLHPRPPARASVVARSDAPQMLATGVDALAGSRLEIEAFDVRWAGGRGEVLVRFAGVAAEQQARRATQILAGVGLEADAVDVDDGLWARQRDGQRSATGVVIRISGLPTDVERLAILAENLGATLVGRTGLGVFWLKLEGLEDDAALAATREVRQRLTDRCCVVLDAPGTVRRQLDVWSETDGARLDLARRLKARFDPEGILNRGVFVGGV